MHKLTYSPKLDLCDFFFYSVNWKLISVLKFADVYDIKRKMTEQLHTKHQKKNYIGASSNKHYVRKVLNTKVTILKKINVSFMVQ